MPERDGYIPGVPCWVDTPQPDPDAAAAFYSGLFGWEIEELPADEGGRYLIARIRGGDVAGIASPPPGAPPTPAWRTYVCVDSADETAAKVRDAGGTVLVEPFDVGDPGRMAAFADLEGAVFYVWQPGTHRGSQIVNEHGSVNFNTLATRDPERAKRFYAAVFGWEMLGMDGAGNAWTLPGYCDHLELANPGLREGIAKMGATPGFEDVVAAIVPAAGDQAPQWSVVFAVDDADATAAQAFELGATIVVPPFDAPWVRSTVIADPQGATFTANQFVIGNRDVPSAESAPATAA